MRRNKTFRRVMFVLVFLLSAQYTYADHLKGGWIKYVFLNKTDGKVNYRISFYQYSDCSEPEKVDDNIFLGVFDASSPASGAVGPITVSRTSLTTERKSDFGPCFQNPPVICYLVAEYTTTISLAENSDGYILTVQRCCRIAGIANVPSSNAYGLTYSITIPGGNYSNNNSPVFDFNDATAICYNSPFSFDFSADDIDGDSLVYSLCSGFTGGTQFNPIVDHPSPPPYNSIPYYSGYTGTAPLGGSASIDPKTGIFSGIAPSQTGTYVAAVCVDEYRNGVFISHTRKELHLDVSNCKLGGAQLDPSYINCDSYDFTFVNRAGDNPDYFYYWDFGVVASAKDTSTKAQPTFTFPDTGVYKVKLKARNNVGCEDSAETQVKIYPGFAPDFDINGSCIINPYNFTDKTITRYGYVNSWQWFFGDTGLLDDTIQNPSYTYAVPGSKSIKLITTSSKGCIDTALKLLEVDTGPDLSLKFRDTLICSIDTLQLQASSTVNGAVFKWSPAYNITDTGINRPFVSPGQTTTYNVFVSYKGCSTNDSVTVNVIDKVDLQLPADTAICKTDSIQITPSTNALYFKWSPPTGLSSAVIQSPVAVPLSTTRYTLLASVGKCTASDAINIKVAPYPVANAGIAAPICYGKTTRLNATIQGSSFLWSPPQGLVNPNSLSTIAGPQSTTTYTLYVTDTVGCPKPVADTVVVKVIPRVIAFAGNDTAIVRQQPLQFNATGGTIYQWTPVNNLSNPSIANPVALFTDGPDTISYNVKVSTPEGCFSNDSIRIYIYETEPQVFVPNAFTPNGDGLNDVFRATVAGMKEFYYLRIYNRWGQLLFNTGTPGKGWDGTYSGSKQPSGTYVYVVNAIDYNNKSYLKKGTFVLIR